MPSPVLSEVSAVPSQLVAVGASTDRRLSATRFLSAMEINGSACPATVRQRRSAESVCSRRSPHVGGTTKFTMNTSYRRMNSGHPGVNTCYVGALSNRDDLTFCQTAFVMPGGRKNSLLLRRRTGCRS